MALSPEERAKIVEEEKLRAKIRTELEKKKSSGCSTGCLALLVLGSLFLLYNLGRDRNTPVSQRLPDVGETATLRGNGKGDVPLAISKAALDRFTTLITANDNEGAALMILAGQVFTVPEGTQCRVIELGSSCEVRILDAGPHQLKTGYLPPGFVHRPEAP